MWRKNREKILDLNDEIDYVTREKWLQTKEKVSKVGQNDDVEKLIKNSPQFSKKMVKRALISN